MRLGQRSLLAANGDGDTAFLLACFGGHVEATELLLSLGERVDSANSFGCTGLIQASAGGHAESMGLSIDSAGGRAESTGLSPLVIKGEVVLQGAKRPGAEP